MKTHNSDRLSNEASFQDGRMKLALEGEMEFRDRFYFINRRALLRYEELHQGLRDKRVLVVGCSDGGVTPLARQGVHVEGIDISPVSISKLQHSIAKEGLEQFATARVMDAEQLEYADATFDVITCSGVLHHLDTDKALRSWSRCLKDEGSVFMFEPLAFHPIAMLFRRLTPKMRTPDEHPLRARDFRLMAKYFGRIERTDFGLLTPVSAALAVIPRLGWLAKLMLPLLERADAAFLGLLPPLRNGCWLTVVRLSAPCREPAAGNHCS